MPYQTIPLGMAVNSGLFASPFIIFFVAWPQLRLLDGSAAAIVHAATTTSAVSHLPVVPSAA